MNRNDILQLCLKDLALLRSSAQNVAHLNLLKAKKSTEFIEIDKVERDLIFQIGKNKAFNIENKELEEELKTIKKQKELILNKIGLTTKDLTPQYRCQYCQDIGYTQNEMCVCLRALLHKQTLQLSGAEKTNLVTFENFNENVASSEEHQKTLLKIKLKFQSIAENFPENHPNFIVLNGKTGVGKTFLTECLASEIVKKGYIASFISAFGMNNLFLNYHTTFSNDKASYLNSLLDPELLVIDDLGTEPILKNITKEYLYLILSERSRLNKLTVVTTNLEPTELLSRYNERIFSRLYNKRESFAAQIVGKDIRIRSK